MTLMSAQSHIELMDAWSKWKRDGDPDAQRLLIERYIPLIDIVVATILFGSARNATRDDLVSYGIMGLYDAVGKFDLQRGLRFETYATWRIRGAIYDGLRKVDWVPRSIRDKIKKIEGAYSVLEQQLMRNVTSAEVGAYLGMTEDAFRTMLFEVSYATTLSVEESMHTEDNEPRYAYIEDCSARRPEKMLHDQFVKECLAIGIERLTERERTVVSLFYYDEMTFTEIAHIMKLTPSRISQLHTRAMQRLRRNMEVVKDLVLFE
jgi:RNA polymerase sigma factor for flagellar operon FliA